MMTEHTLYDWFKDIWLPAAGAILIPVAIAFFTWWFGASRLEKQKEMQELRDNLNLLMNLIGVNIVNLLAVQKYTVNMALQINNNILNAVQLEKNHFFDVIFFNDFIREIDIARYAQCISKDDEYLQKLITIKNLNYQIDAAIQHRNIIVKDLSICENNELKYARITSFVEESQKDLYELNLKIDLGLKLGKEFIEKTKALEGKFDNLKLIQVDFDNDDFYKKAKKEYQEYLHTLKEQKHD